MIEPDTCLYILLYFTPHDRCILFFKISLYHGFLYFYFIFPALVGSSSLTLAFLSLPFLYTGA